MWLAPRSHVWSEAEFVDAAAKEFEDTEVSVTRFELFLVLKFYGVKLLKSEQMTGLTYLTKEYTVFLVIMTSPHLTNLAYG